MVDKYCIVMDSAAKLASLLDQIDSSKKNEDDKAPRLISVWYEFFDQKSQKSYYHNYVTNQTQWDKPDTDRAEIIPPVSLTDTSSDIPVERAFFSKASGRFSHAGSQSYWQKMGREDDKAGRQLGVFMDLSTLEENREEAKRMKEAARQRSGKRGDVDWTTYKEKKQDTKKRKAQSWLYEP